MYKYFILFLLFAAELPAQSDSVIYRTEEITVTANIYETNIFETPNSVKVVDCERINKSNGSRISDVIFYVPGVYIRSYGGSSSLKTISLNGLGGENTVVLYNGIKLNSEQNSQFDISLISKDNIDRVEILNNGASSLYGSQSIGGVLNIIPVNSSLKTNNFTLEAAIQTGSYRFRNYSVGFSKKLGISNTTFKFSSESSDNDYDYFYYDGSEKISKKRDNSSYSVENYFFNSSFNTDNNNKFDVFINYLNENRNIPSVETGNVSAQSIQKDKNLNIIINNNLNISDKFSFSGSLNFQNYLLNYTVSDFLKSFYKNNLYSLTGKFRYSDKRIVLISAVELNYSSCYSSELEKNPNRFNPSLSLISELLLFKGFKIFPSLRFDNFSDIKRNYLSSKIGFNYRPFSSLYFNLRGSIGNNFRMPSFNDLYWTGAGNTDLKPEKSFNADFGIIYSFDYFIRSVIEINYVFVNYQDKIVWKPNNFYLWKPVNIGESKSNTFNVYFKLFKEINDFYFSIDGGYSYNYAKKTDETNGKYYRLIYVPVELFKLNFIFQYKDYGFNLFYNFIGKQYTDFENKNYLPPVDILDGNVLINLQIYKFRSQFRFEVNNILNQNYQLISGYPMPLRNYKIGFSVFY